jgi:microcystin-dependent protein
MGTPYIGEIRMFGGNFAPSGWAFCNGQVVSISEYEALFQLIGTTYGGDGQSTFAMPDLRSRVPIHMGTGASLTTRVIGEAAGVENVTLNLTQIPAHTHNLLATSADATTPTPSAGVMLGSNAGVKVYTPRAASVATGSSGGPVGGSQAHNNVMPVQAISFIISLFGIFPSPS